MNVKDTANAYYIYECKNTEQLKINSQKTELGQQVETIFEKRFNAGEETENEENNELHKCILILLLKKMSKKLR